MFVPRVPAHLSHHRREDNEVLWASLTGVLLPAIADPLQHAQHAFCSPPPRWPQSCSHGTKTNYVTAFML